VSLVGKDANYIEIYKNFYKKTTAESAGYLFEYIRKCIQELDVNKDKLTEEIFKNISTLITWDSQKARDMVSLLPKLTEANVDSLEAFPDVQLTYLQKVMDRSKSPTENVSDETKLKYLTLLCKLRPDGVVSALKNYIFPLEPSLKICQDFNNLHGQAYLKSRTRNINDAIRIYIEVLIIVM
jgi:hypothetical protein